MSNFQILLRLFYPYLFKSFSGFAPIFHKLNTFLGGWGVLEIKVNSAQLELELGLSLAISWIQSLGISRGNCQGIKCVEYNG
jgi:hypothetical protein